MRYALLIYSTIAARESASAEDRSRLSAVVTDVLDRPHVTGWVRLGDVESATTLRHEQGRTLLTDGPFVDSKEFLGGLIFVEADDLDGALAVADELQDARTAGAIEVRPIREEDPRHAR
jgi:hypothetical protein